MDPRRLVRWLDVGACILLYMTVGPALILVNKQILTTYGFGYPMLVSGLGQASSAIGATFVVKIMKWQPLSDQAQKMTWVFTDGTWWWSARPSRRRCVSATRATCT